MVKHKVVSVVAILFVVAGIESASISNKADININDKLKEFNDNLEIQLRTFVIAQWNQGSNITDENEAALVS